MMGYGLGCGFLSGSGFGMTLMLVWWLLAIIGLVAVVQLIINQNKK